MNITSAVDTEIGTFEVIELPEGDTVIFGRERVGGYWSTTCADRGVRLSSLSHTRGDAFKELRVIAGEKMSAVYC